MASQRVTRILCAAGPSGSVGAVERLLELADERDVHALAVIGDLGGHAGGYRELFRALANTRRPVYWVPGPGDAPAERYLRETYNMETVFPLLHGVHGMAAFAEGNVLFAGLGGEVSDDPEAPRDERQRLRYPRWEAEYRLGILRQFEYNELVLLFHTPPAHKGLGSAGSEALAELVNTYRPRLVVCDGDQGTELLGRSRVVAPGNLTAGQYAIADTHSQKVELEGLGVAPHP